MRCPGSRSIVSLGGCPLARHRNAGSRRERWETEVIRRGKAKPCLRIVRKVFAPVTATAGVVEHRQAALERIGWILTDWERARTDQDLVENRMVAVLGQLALTDLVCSIDGLSPVGAAAILAETGDLSRFTSARAVVKLAGLAPRDRMSCPFAGKARVSGAGRPLPAPDQPGGQRAQAHAGSDHRRRRDPAAAVRRRHHRLSLGPGHRCQGPTAGQPCGGGCGVTRFA
jgi:hypothetical protein